MPTAAGPDVGDHDLKTGGECVRRIVLLYRAVEGKSGAEADFRVPPLGRGPPGNPELKRHGKRRSRGLILWKSGPPPRFGQELRANLRLKNHISRTGFDRLGRRWEGVPERITDWIARWIEQVWIQLETRLRHSPRFQGRVGRIEGTLELWQGQTLRHEQTEHRHRPVWVEDRPGIIVHFTAGFQSVAFLELADAGVGFRAEIAVYLEHRVDLIFVERGLGAADIDTLRPNLQFWLGRTHWCSPAIGTILRRPQKNGAKRSPAFPRGRNEESTGLVQGRGRGVRSGSGQISEQSRLGRPPDSRRPQKALALGCS